MLRDPRFFLEQIKKNIKVDENGEEISDANKQKKDSKYEIVKKQNGQHLASDGMIDDEELELKDEAERNWKSVQLQIKALQMLMTKEYDKVLILTSIMFILSVMIYVLLGPDYFNLQGESWKAASVVVNSFQILLLVGHIFDNLTQAVAYKCDCIR